VKYEGWEIKGEMILLKGRKWVGRRLRGKLKGPRNGRWRIGEESQKEKEREKIRKGLEKCIEKGKRGRGGKGGTEKERERERENRKEFEGERWK
jgi:hypothetical protein